MKWTLLFLLFFVAGCREAKNPAKAGDLEGKVVRIADGDTFTLLTDAREEKKVRLYGIDAPEKAQDFGQVARQHLADLIFGQQVQVEEKDRDRYGRIVGVVHNGAAQSVNEAMLQAGLAWHYTQYDRNPAWAQLQAEAQAARRGLWAQPQPTPPWNWRRERR